MASGKKTFIMSGSKLSSLVVQRERVCLQGRKYRFDPWVVKMPWRRAWQPTPVFLPGESPWTEELACYSPWGCKEYDTIER